MCIILRRIVDYVHVAVLTKNSQASVDMDLSV